MHYNMLQRFAVITNHQSLDEGVLFRDGCIASRIEKFDEKRGGAWSAGSLTSGIGDTDKGLVEIKTSSS